MRIKLFLGSIQNQRCFNVEIYRRINFDKSTLNQYGYHVDRRGDVISTYVNIESTLSVCWETVNKNAILRQTVRVSIKFISKTFFSKADPCSFIDLFVHSSLSAEHRKTSILFELSIKPISESFTK